MDQINKTPVPLPGTPQNDDAAKRTHFTPCRRLGLKRKSANTPETVGVVTLTPNSGFKNHKHSFETPKRVIAFHDSSPKVSPIPALEPKRDAAIACEEPKENEQHVNPSQKSSLPKRCTPRFCAEVSSEKKILELQNVIKEKEEQLEALNMALQEKNKGLDLGLAERTEVWRKGCQQALRQLHEKTRSLGTEITMTEMIKKLGIPFNVVLYDPDLEDFQE